MTALCDAIPVVEVTAGGLPALDVRTARGHVLVWIVAVRAVCKATALTSDALQNQMLCAQRVDLCTAARVLAV